MPCKLATLQAKRGTYEPIVEFMCHRGSLTKAIEVDIADAPGGSEFWLAVFGRTSRSIMEGFVFVPARPFGTRSMVNGHLGESISK
jgi:2-methylaconitate cis-trans-isomerase PrpF